MRKLCLCCCACPMSVIVAIVAIVVPKIIIPHLPKDACEKDAAGHCKLMQGTGTVNCEDGAFVEHAKQPYLGLLHVRVVSGEAVTFASLDLGSCSTSYSMACGSNGIEVHETSTCSKDSQPVPASLGKSWEVCAKGHKLRSELSVIDLTFDVATGIGSTVAGCIRISTPEIYPQLATMRGSFVEQTAVVIQKKKELGGCPTWQTDEDRMARSRDFTNIYGPPGGFFAEQHIKRALDMVEKLQKGEDLEKPTLFNVFLMMGPVGALGMDGMGSLVRSLYCGVVGPGIFPAGDFVTVVRHAEIKELVGDPHGGRPHQIGMGNSEVCFEPTLPVFLNTGEPPHTQVRKLWDAVGMRDMHLGEIGEMPEIAPSIIQKIQLAAMEKLGIHFQRPDVPLYVTPLFLERLWGRKPTTAEAAAIGEYGTFGGPCIMSQIVEKLPFIPTKLKHIRAAALDFARSSPVGKKLAQEIMKPDYAELRQVYETRPSGVVDGALMALADASLFAGLVGTSGLTGMAMTVISGGPKFVKMFRQNTTSFMLEVMRTHTPVAGSLRMTRQPWKINMLGRDLELKPGFKVFQGTGLAGGLDAKVFPDPLTFNTSRTNLGETLNFNGLTKHVLTFNYEGAPRYCPGGVLSLKIATKIVAHLTKDMSDE